MSRILKKIATNITDKDGLKKRHKEKLLPRISRVLKKLATDITDKDGYGFDKTQRKTVKISHGFHG
jgi:hypothetical protein